MRVSGGHGGGYERGSNGGGGGNDDDVTIFDPGGRSVFLAFVFDGVVWCNGFCVGFPECVIYLRYHLSGV